MRVSNQVITALQKIITGDQLRTGECIAPYQSGPDLVQFFNEFGFDDEYSWGGGFPSRWAYCESHLEELNGKRELTKVIEAALDPRRFLDTDFIAEIAVDYLNGYLMYDGYEVRKSGEFYRVLARDGYFVDVDANLDSVSPSSREFIEEQIQKCRHKISGELLLTHGLLWRRSYLTLRKD